MKIALISNTDYYIWQFRRGLLNALKNGGHEVFAVSPAGNYVRLIEKLGVTHIPVTIDRKGMSPLKDIIFFLDLCKIFKKERFDIINTFTIKPNIYGSLAGRLIGIQTIISSVVGLGYMFAESMNSVKHTMAKGITKLLYKTAFKFSSYVIFQNQDDLDILVSMGLVDKSKTRLIRSSGVDIAEYTRSNYEQATINKLKCELSIGNGTVVITMASRLIWEKGVKEFIGAAKILKERYPETIFLLLGDIDNGNPSAIPEAYLHEAGKNKHICWLGYRSDIKNIFMISDIFVLPSYYREGIPKVILEAMAMGLPIVTTNSVGCKETVYEGKNGYLIPIKDVVTLSNKIELLIKDKKTRETFGNYSRLKVESEFDEKIVIKETMKVYELI